MAKRVLKRRSKVNIPICAAAVLLCLTMFSTHLTSGIYARYSTTASGSDSARVISFGDIDLAVLESADRYIAPGAPLAWNATVNVTKSESATYVFVEIMPAAGGSASETEVTLFAEGPTWTMDDGWTYVKDTEKPYVYYVALDANETLSKKIFEKDTAIVPETLTEAEIQEIGTIKGAFSASVVQSNGFDSVETAWTSLSKNHKDS